MLRNFRVFRRCLCVVVGVQRRRCSSVSKYSATRSSTPAATFPAGFRSTPAYISAARTAWRGRRWPSTPAPVSPCSCCPANARASGLTPHRRRAKTSPYTSDESDFSCVNEHVYSPCRLKGKGSPYSTAERRVPELIPVLGSQPAGDVSHKPGGRLPSLSTRPAVTLATLKRPATDFAAW